MGCEEYRLDKSCKRCEQKKRVVFYCDLDYDLSNGDRVESGFYQCVHCLWGFKDNASITLLGYLTSVSEEAEFHLWLLEQSRIKPSDLVHPNPYIRKEAGKRAQAEESEQIH